MVDKQQKIERLCCSDKSVSSEYVKNPDASPVSIAESLFSTHHLKAFAHKGPDTRRPLTASDLEWARRCGKFGGTNPSELFLHAYHDLLQCIGDDPLANCCAPSLCGSVGYVPMTIIAPLNDQLRHMSNLIVRAKKEVLLATNFWKASGATTFVKDALLELSKRARARGERVVVKLMYDRGSVKQVIDNHQNVSPSGWQASGVDLPAPEEMPNVDLSVVNFHRPPLGTFHCKFMIVDRSIATVSSNNIQDNDNLEMMSHIEGPIVDSLWETFLVSWHNKLEPSLPCRDSPAGADATADQIAGAHDEVDAVAGAEAATGNEAVARVEKSDTVSGAEFRGKNAPVTGKPLPSYGQAAFQQLFEPDGSFRKPEEPPTEELPEHMPKEPHYDDDIAGEINRMRSVLNPRGSESHQDAVARHLNKPTGLSIRATAPKREPELHFFPFIPVVETNPVPMAMASRKPYANLNNECVFVPQNEVFLSLLRNAKRTVFIQTPDLNAKHLLPELIAAVERGLEVTYYVCLGYNDTGEMLPGQGGTNEQNANYLYNKLSDDKKALLKIFFYVAADQDHPIHNSFKQRSCHIKLMIVDESVAVQGSGNQDTQSWYHSQEVNVMIDSPVVCKAWREGIERNQNTALYGRVSNDGCYYDKDGNLAAGSYGLNQGMFGWAKGAIGILNKAQGK